MITTVVADEMLRCLYVASLRPLATLEVLVFGLGLVVVLDALDAITARLP